MTDLLAEYRAAREDTGLIDRSEAGKLAIVGKDRHTWLQGMVSNDVRLLTRTDSGSGLAPALQACILNATGHVMTDLTLIDIRSASELAAAIGVAEPDFVLLDLPGINLAAIAALLDRFLITEEVEIVDVTDRLGCLSLQGPGTAGLRSGDGRAALFAGSLSDVLSIADHTGSGGIDCYFAASELPVLRQRLSRFRQIGDAVQEILRIEAGIPKYGTELDANVIALEANLGPTHISLIKGCYLGQEIIARIDSRGHTNRALTGLTFAAGQTPQPGDRVYGPGAHAEETGRETGRITSVVQASPAAHGRPIALAYVRHEHRQPGSLLHVGDRALEAEVVPLPFYRHELMPALS